MFFHPIKTIRIIKHHPNKDLAIFNILNLALLLILLYLFHDLIEQKSSLIIVLALDHDIDIVRIDTNSINEEILAQINCLSSNIQQLITAFHIVINEFTNSNTTEHNID